MTWWRRRLRRLGNSGFHFTNCAARACSSLPLICIQLGPQIQFEAFNRALVDQSKAFNTVTHGMSRLCAPPNSNPTLIPPSLSQSIIKGTQSCQHYKHLVLVDGSLPNWQKLTLCIKNNFKHCDFSRTRQQSLKSFFEKAAKTIDHLKAFQGGTMTL